MGLFLIILGIILWFLVSTLLGILCVVVGLILLFVPGTGGYSDWRRRPR